MAFVERQFDPAVARVERHYRAMDMGRENGIELAPQPLREQLLQGRAAGRPQIRLVAVDPLLPLAAADRDAVHGGLDGLDMLLAGLPHPKRHAVTPESMFRGVEIGGDQMLVRNEFAVAGPQAARGSQFLQIGRRDLKLDLGLGAHRRLLKP